MHSYQGLITKEKPFVYYGYTELLQKSSSSITQTPGPVPGTDIELVMSHWVLTNLLLKISIKGWIFFKEKMPGKR